MLGRLPSVASVSERIGELEVALVRVIPAGFQVVGTVERIVQDYSERLLVAMPQRRQRVVGLQRPVDLGWNLDPPLVGIASQRSHPASTNGGYVAGIRRLVVDRA